jgi:hypothetical protein
LGVDWWLPSSSTNGVLIHRQLTDASGNPLGSYLLDMTPTSTAGMSDAPLPPGATWTDPLGYLTFKVDSIASTSAQITVTSTLKRVPSVVGLTYADAVKAIKAVSLVATQKFVVDPTCNDVGTVIAQTPTAGTPLPAGYAVKVTVAVAPPTPCP